MCTSYQFRGWFENANNLSASHLNEWNSTSQRMTTLCDTTKTTTITTSHTNTFVSIALISIGVSVSANKMCVHWARIQFDWNSSAFDSFRNSHQFIVSIPEKRNDIHGFEYGWFLLDVFGLWKKNLEQKNSLIKRIRNFQCANIIRTQTHRNERSKNRTGENVERKIHVYYRGMNSWTHLTAIQIKSMRNVECELFS